MLYRPSVRGCISPELGARGPIIYYIDIATISTSVGYLILELTLAAD